LDTRQSELEALQAQVDDYSAQIGTLRSQLLTNTRSLERKGADGNRRIAEIERQVNDKTGKVERLHSQIRMVKNRNAGQDLQPVPPKKELKPKTEDFFQLNVGLDAKQQKLNMCALFLSLAMHNRPICNRWVVEWHLSVDIEKPNIKEREGLCTRCHTLFFPHEFATPVDVGAFVQRLRLHSRLRAEGTHSLSSETQTTFFDRPQQDRQPLGRMSGLWVDDERPLPSMTTNARVEWTKTVPMLNRLNEASPPVNLLSLNWWFFDAVPV
jgi:hypothetical protein